MVNVDRSWSDWAALRDQLNASALLACTQLTTFRQPRDRLIEARELSYFRWWNLLSFRALGILGLVLLLWAVVVDYKHGGRNTPVILFAACLSIVGMVMVLLNCFFAQL